MSKKKEKKQKVKKQPEHLPLNPLFLKDAKDKTVAIYLEIKAYDSAIKKINDYLKLKNKWQKC